MKESLFTAFTLTLMFLISDPSMAQSIVHPEKAILKRVNSLGVKNILDAKVTNARHSFGTNYDATLELKLEVYAKPCQKFSTTSYIEIPFGSGIIAKYATKKDRLFNLVSLETCAGQNTAATHVIDLSITLDHHFENKDDIYFEDILFSSGLTPGRGNLIGVRTHLDVINGTFTWTVVKNLSGNFVLKREPGNPFPTLDKDGNPTLIP